MHKNALEIAAWSISGTVMLKEHASALMKRSMVPQMDWKDTLQNLPIFGSSNIFDWQKQWQEKALQLGQVNWQQYTEPQ